jgi:hypothetical protein
MNVLAGIGLLCAMPAAFATTPQDYATVLPIETHGDSAAWQIELNPAVYAWTQDAALRDIAVFNAAGQPVPLAAWQVATADSVREQRGAVPVLALPATTAARGDTDLRLLVERDADGRLKRIETADTAAPPNATGTRDWLIDLGAFKQGIDAISLRWTTPASGVIARFAVDASDDLQTWRNLRSDAAIVLLDQDGTRVERREITLDLARGNYLRLRRLDPGADLVGLGVEAHQTQREAGARAPLQWLNADRQETLGGANTTGTRFFYTLPAALPVEALRIELANDNALAQITLSALISGNAAKPSWDERARFVAFRLRQGDALIDSGDIAISSGSRQREFRLESRTPLAQAPRLAFGYRPDRLVFLAEGAGPYLLTVGSARERRADYPLGAAIVSLRGQFGEQWQPPLATLGSARESAGASALAAIPQPYAWRRWLLWGVLVGGAALVAGIALSLLRGKR